MSLCVLHFLDLQFADEKDVLEVYSDIKLDKGKIGSKTLAAKYSGLWQTESSQTSLPFSFSRQYTKESGILMIRFTTDDHNQTRGFRINYRVIKSKSQGGLASNFNHY